MDLGRKDWKERAIARQAARIALRGPDIGPFDHLFYVRTATFPRGHRLNPERLRKMNIGEDLRPNEVHLIQQLMFQREDALAWEFQHMSQIHEDVQPPYKIRTIPHTAWQEKNFPLPKKLVPIVNAMVDVRAERGHSSMATGSTAISTFLFRRLSDQLNQRTFGSLTMLYDTTP
ncbi:hypothetical protein A1F94_011122 [Pyrenophora tritici-repentis]|nr:hypothetical protein A1F94_011122 [Pyrenophora tritici-repentis]